MYIDNFPHMFMFLYKINQNNMNRYLYAHTIDIRDAKAGIQYKNWNTNVLYWWYKHINNSKLFIYPQMQV